jgi:sirohydrochlorin ferrochelatase
MKKLPIFFICIIAAYLTGWFLLDFLTVHPLKIALFLFLALLSVLVGVYAIIRLDTRSEKILGIVLAFVSFIAGYAVHAQLFLNQEDSRYVPAITRQASDETPGHKAIVYFTHGEPQTYNPIGWINQFKEFDEQNIKFVPFLVRPLFVYQLRNKYLEVGQSHHRITHQEMLKNLESQYRNSGDSLTRFYLCFLDDEPRPDAAVINALNDGADTIIVANVFLTVSNHTAEGQNLIKALEVTKKYAVEMTFTEPMWSSETLRSAFVEKVYAQIGDTPKEKVAIALVGHGQPDEWDEEWPTETSQEIAFRQDIMDLFVEEGFGRENLGSAWMEFKDPKPATLMETFVKNGVTKVFYFSAAISADALHSQIDVPRLVQEYDFPEGVEAINLGAWNNHPTVIKAIKERIDSHF